MAAVVGHLHGLPRVFMRQLFKRKRVDVSDDGAIPSSFYPNDPGHEDDFTSVMAKERLKSVCTFSGESEIRERSVDVQEPSSDNSAPAAVAPEVEIEQHFRSRLGADEGDHIAHDLTPDQDSSGATTAKDEFVSRNQTVAPPVKSVGSAPRGVPDSTEGMDPNSAPSDGPTSRTPGQGRKPLIERRFPDPSIFSSLHAEAEKTKNENLSFVDAIIEERRAKAISENLQRNRKNSMSKTQKETVLKDMDMDNTTVVSEGTKTTGNTDTERNMLVHGTYEGNLRCKVLVVGPMGSVKGNIDAEEVRVQGVISGDVSANIIRLGGAGFIEGEFVALEFYSEGGRMNCTQAITIAEEDMGRDMGASEQRHYPRVGLSGAMARSVLRQRVKDEVPA